MDILTHTLSGVAVATCTAAFVPKIRTKASLLLVGAIGGAFPDLDAISLWSRFDGIFGRLFNLDLKGSSIYGAKLWYSHHAFLHSLLGSLLFALLLVFFISFFKRKGDGIWASICSKSIYFVTFLFAYWSHLLGDLPTPSSVWGGIGLFWPSSDYVGGYGKVWWWNNYDIFLLIVSCITINVVILFFQKILQKKVKIIAPVVLSIFFILILIQVNTRQYDYAYNRDNSEYMQMEENSKQEQRRILGKTLYRIMEDFDKKLKFYF